jgi:hypothetical protein
MGAGNGAHSYARGRTNCTDSAEPDLNNQTRFV